MYGRSLFSYTKPSNFSIRLLHRRLHAPGGNQIMRATPLRQPALRFRTVGTCWRWHPRARGRPGGQQLGLQPGAVPVPEEASPCARPLELPPDLQGGPACTVLFLTPKNDTYDVVASCCVTARCGVLLYEVDPVRCRAAPACWRLRKGIGMSSDALLSPHDISYIDEAYNHLPSRASSIVEPRTSASRECPTPAYA